MKTFLRLKLFAATIATLLFAAGSVAAQSVSVGSSAKVVAPLAVTKVNDLTFGTIAPSAAAGTVAIVNDVPTASATVQLITDATTPRNSGSFTVTGDAARGYNVTLTNCVSGTAITTVSLASGANNMSVSSLAINGGATKSLTAGAGAFKLDGTLNVGANQASGSYANVANSLCVVLAYT